MTNITEVSIQYYEFVYLTSSTDSSFYYYLEFTPKLGVLIIFYDNDFKAYLCVPENPNPIPLPGIKYIEDIENIAKYLGYWEED